MPQRLLLAIVMVSCTCLASPVAAGTLNGHPGAFFDGTNTWTGSTPFDNSAGVAGYIDWAVFAPTAFPFAGYAQPVDEYVYAYQVFSTGTDVISSFFVALANPAGNIGDFDDLPGQSPIGSSLNPLINAEWRFSGLAMSMHSTGLAYSAPEAPEDLFGVTVGGGQYAYLLPLPSPSPGGDVPEPATLSLLAAGSLLSLRRRR
ncbi:MAG: PEP-CTERM sorting domain-containing protein [Planctomycetota bacterium]